MRKNSFFIITNLFGFLLIINKKIDVIKTTKTVVIFPIDEGKKKITIRKKTKLCITFCFAIALILFDFWVNK